MRRLLKYFAFVLFVGIGSGIQAQFSSPGSGSLSATTVPQGQLIQPAELVKLLKESGSVRPVVFQVGSFVMFQQAHIPNASNYPDDTAVFTVESSHSLKERTEKKPFDRGSSSRTV